MIDRKFTSDWVTPHVDHWRKLTQEFVGQPNLRFLEIGSHEGRSACWWLDNVLTHESARLWCLDPWHWKPEREELFIANTAQHAAKIHRHKGDSARILPTLEEASFDWAYVDGSHEAASVLLDGLLCLRLLKPGGVLLFDDYELPITNPQTFEKIHYPPKPGIQAFLQVCAWQVQVLYKGYQLAVRKR